MSLEYNSGIKLVLQKAICQSDPERSTSKTEMKSKYEAKLSCAPVNKTDIMCSVATSETQLFAISTSETTEKI